MKLDINGLNLNEKNIIYDYLNISEYNFFMFNN